MTGIEILVNRFLQFMQQRDLNNLVEQFADNIDWDIPGNKTRAIWLGKRMTKESVSHFFKTLWENTEAINATVGKILFDDNYAVIIGDFRVKMLSTGKIVNSFFCIQLSTENNLITKYRLFEDSYAVSESLIQ